MDTAKFEITLTDGQRFTAWMPVGCSSSSSETWIWCNIFHKDVSIRLDQVQSVKPAGVNYQTERQFTTYDDEGNFKRYEYEDNIMPPVKAFPFGNVPDECSLADEMPTMRGSKTYVGNQVFWEIDWQYAEYIGTGAGHDDRLKHIYSAYMSEADYVKVMVQWARELAKRNIAYANSN